MNQNEKKTMLKAICKEIENTKILKESRIKRKKELKNIRIGRREIRN